MESPFLQTSGLLKYIGLFLSGICHQFPEHSLFIAGVQMPLCARCTGTYLGALLGLCFSWWKGRSRAAQFPPRSVLVLQMLFFSLWGIDGLNSYCHFLTSKLVFYTPNHCLRLTTGMLSGLSLSLLVVPMFNSTLWRNSDTQRIVNSIEEFGLILLPTMILVLLLQADISALRYPFLLASVLSVLLLLTIVNAPIFILLSHRENSIGCWKEAWPPLAWGLVLSMAQISALALLRHWLVSILSAGSL